ncbi:unnamed protein product [Spirodela intermedia]|uniref:Uncharacterized protein n=1 Tax=Spirodela intermedia TaxID=51605 RepID=A0A7I8KYL2_SPIIN|nr:unnamed protein product [Spirodela intermedia]
MSSPLDVDNFSTKAIEMSFHIWLEIENGCNNLVRVSVDLNHK